MHRGFWKSETILTSCKEFSTTFLPCALGLIGSGAIYLGVEGQTMPSFEGCDVCDVCDVTFHSLGVFGRRDLANGRRHARRGMQDTQQATGSI